MLKILVIFIGNPDLDSLSIVSDAFLVLCLIFSAEQIRSGKKSRLFGFRENQAVRYISV